MKTIKSFKNSNIKLFESDSKFSSNIEKLGSREIQTSLIMVIPRDVSRRFLQTDADCNTENVLYLDDGIRIGRERPRKHTIVYHESDNKIVTNR